MSTTSHRELINTVMTNTYSLTTALRRVGALRQAVDTVLYQEAVTDILAQYREALESVLANEEVKLVVGWGTDWLTALTMEEWRVIDQALEGWLRDVSTLTIYVPVQLDAEAEKMLGEWSRSAFDEKLLLDLQVDPNTVGGCAIVKDGHYIDMSLGAQLNEQPQLVPSILQSYDH